MELESRKDELMAEIVKVEKEIEVKTAELEEVRKKLNKESLDEVYDEEFEEDKETEEDKEELDDDSDDEDEDFDEDESNEEELKEKEAKLSEEVLVLQMRLVALNKQLNDVLAGQAADKFTSKED